MVKVSKSRYPPKVVFTGTGHPQIGQIKWVVATRDIIRDYRANPLPFTNGSYKFDADYGAIQFRNRLLQNQGPKCCYCEKPVHNGQLEHFRPKRAWQSTKGAPFIYPGYYWLAYKWENLLISCAECNNKGQKGNLFPLIGPFRATDHSLNYLLENPVIINPAIDKPNTYISFNLDVPIGIDRAGRGIANINIFKLRDRADLKQPRMDRLELYRTKKIIATLPGPVATITRIQIQEARKFLHNMTNRKQPFAGMINENIKNGLI